MGFVTGAIVGHDALDLDAKARVIGHRALQEGDRATRLLVGHDLAEADARVVVDREVDELPAGVLVPTALSNAGDPVAGTLEAAELFDVDVDQLARPLAFITANRSLRLERAQPVEAQSLENATDRGGR